MPMSQINGGEFSKIWDSPWPLQDSISKPREEMLRENVTSLTVPEELRTEPYALHLSVNASSGDWKSDWVFEGIGITHTE